MATIKERVRRKNSSGTYDIIHFETDSSIVLMSNGTSVEDAVNSKQPRITGGASSITTSNLTANRALISNSSGKVAVATVTATELGYLDGVTSAIQTQLNNKAASAHTHTGVYAPNSHTHTKDQITDLANWAKQPNKPTYTYSEVGAAAASHNHDGVYAAASHNHEISQVNGLQNEINSLKTSVSNGKSAVASAITDKGVSTSATADFNTMASNIRKIKTGAEIVQIEVCSSPRKLAYAGFTVQFYHTDEYGNIVQKQVINGEDFDVPGPSVYINVPLGGVIYTKSDTCKLKIVDTATYFRYTDHSQDIDIAVIGRKS